MMIKKSNVVLITGHERRHRYVALMLSKEVNLIGTVVEKKRIAVDNKRIVINKDKKVFLQHLTERDEVEKRLLGDPRFSTVVPRLDVDTGDVNLKSTYCWVRDLKPDFVILYGSSIIKPPLLNDSSYIVVNMHLGLSPYYRGSGTNFWPLVNNCPECIGTTIHLAVSNVDAGPILAQVRPDIIVTDGPHEIGTKAIIAGVRTMSLALNLLINNKLIPAEQNTSNGSVFKRSDFNADSVNDMRNNFKQGMLKEYVNNKKNRNSLYPIVETSQ